MKHTNPINTLIKKWPTRADLAADLGVKVDRVHKWAQSGSIPQEFMLSVVNAAKKRGFDLTADDMIKAHSGKAEPKKQTEAAE